MASRTMLLPPFLAFIYSPPPLPQLDLLYSLSNTILSDALKFWEIQTRIESRYCCFTVPTTLFLQNPIQHSIPKLFGHLKLNFHRHLTIANKWQIHFSLVEILSFPNNKMATRLAQTQPHECTGRRGRKSASS